MRFLLTIFLLTGVLSQNGQAQQVADTLDLGEFNIKATRVYVSDSHQPVAISRVDSSLIQSISLGTASEVLQNYAPVHVRSNGPGGLATFSIRGYSPSQTQVLWNGFELNHAMLGLTDLSLIPTFAMEQIEVASGSGNTSFGGKGGGTVAIKTRQPNSEAGLSQAIGSFGQKVTEGFVGVKVGKWNISFIGGLENSENDFTYQIREFNAEAGGVIDVNKKRTNNALTSQTGILSVSRKDENHTFSSTLWTHNMENEIPGGINSLTPQAHQDDSFLRWMSRYKTRISRHKIEAKLYVNRQKLDFFNSPANINSRSTTTSVIADIELQTSFAPNFQLISAVQVGQSQVKANEYSGSPQRTQLSTQVNPIWQILPQVHLYGGFRADYYSDFNEAFSANTGLNIEIIKNTLFVKAQAGRNFVAPTFNDLFWPELGKPDLKPETNLKYEGSVLFNVGDENLENALEFTLYDGSVSNGIRWLPGADGQSRPQNIEHLRLWGYEVREEAELSLGSVNAKVWGMFLHSLAEIEKPRFADDKAVNKQLRYTPKNQLKAGMQLGFKNLNTNFSYHFTDKRFSSADHSSPFDPMPAYRQLNWSGSYRLDIQSLTFIPKIGIQNITDEKYAVIKGYPMPGRSFQCNLTVKITL